MPKPLPLGTQRDCRKANSSARREINGIWLESRPRKGFDGYWTTENGRIVVRKKRRGDPRRSTWKVYLDGQLVGNSLLTNLTECLRANEWAIKKGAV